MDQGKDDFNINIELMIRMFDPQFSLRTPAVRVEFRGKAALAEANLWIHIHRSAMMMKPPITCYVSSVYLQERRKHKALTSLTVVTSKPTNSETRLAEDRYPFQGSDK